MSPPLAVMSSIPRSHYRLRHARSQKLDEQRPPTQGDARRSPSQRPSLPQTAGRGSSLQPEKAVIRYRMADRHRQSQGSGQVVPDNQRALPRRGSKPDTHEKDGAIAIAPPPSPQAPPQASSRTYARAYRSTSCSGRGTAPSSPRRPQRETAPESPSRIRTRASAPACAPSI